jgi:hypothetical protein
MMTDPIFVKETHYYIKGVDLDRPLTDDRSVDAAREEAASLLKHLKAALVNPPESVRILDKSEVPTPTLGASRDCVVCSYDKMVNFVIVEHWPPFQSASRGCEDCGIRIESHTEVVNNQLVKDIVEAWGLQYVSAPQP